MRMKMGRHIQAKHISQKSAYAQSGALSGIFKSYQMIILLLSKKIKIHIAHSSSLLDMNVPDDQKLYGYHRLDDPKVTYQNGSGIKVCNFSEVKIEENNKPVGKIDRNDINLTPPEPNKY